MSLNEMWKRDRSDHNSSHWFDLCICRANKADGGIHEVKLLKDYFEGLEERLFFLLYAFYFIKFWVNTNYHWKPNEILKALNSLSKE